MQGGNMRPAEGQKYAENMRKYAEICGNMRKNMRSFSAVVKGKRLRKISTLGPKNFSPINQDTKKFLSPRVYKFSKAEMKIGRIMIYDRNVQLYI